MILTSLDGCIQQVNKAFCDSLKYESSELIGQQYFSFSPSEDLIKDLISQRKILSGEIKSDQGEKRYLAKDNTIIYTIFKLTLLRDDQGNPLNFIQQIVDITDRKKAENQLSHDALHDKLTGLVNREVFLEHLDRALLRCQIDKNKLCAVLFLDLDQFKRLNESLGHHFGDQLLIEIARKIESVVQKKDILARLGGDEFAILLDDLMSESMAIAMAESVLSICNQPLQVSNYEIFTSVSIGIAFSNIGYSKAENMLRDADLTTYQAKEMGRNCYCIFDQKMHHKLIKRVEIESLLRKAISKITDPNEKHQEFILYYQPIVSFFTRKLTGFEALIRWNNPNLGLVSPFNFIPISEEIGLIIILGEWILLQAAKQAMEWEKMFPNLSLKIAVNLSGKQLNEQNLLQRIDHILTKTKVNPKLLKLEITESILMDNFDYTQNILKELQNRNFQISLDDFGTGYSSLSYLHNLPIDTLKIDRSFIIPIEKNPEKSDIIKAIITLAHNLSLDVIAEGIETEKQASVLTNLNCDYGQGYLFSKPVNAQEATNLIKKNTLIKF